ncbi:MULTISPECIES: SGNH/GDSL hydrolase family protein [unclassified Saccharicrinis]|uniref:SGNH/GDSL hydrolase family protein n=1 Tax=unclassified Saccharicrinis TaxID=2646859 RepID=UPI003D353CAA
MVNKISKDKVLVFRGLGIRLVFGVILFLGSHKALDAQENDKQQKDSDYLAELKEQLVLVWPKNRTINIVFHGHSVPSGYYRTPKVNTLSAYPHLFLEYLKENYPNAVINCITTSIGGEQSEQGAKRFKKDVLPLKPDLLFIDYALNDRGIGLERTEKAWRFMIKKALSSKIKLVLLTPTPDLKEDILNDNTKLAGYSNLIKRLGEEYKIPVVDVYAQFKKMKREGVDLKLFMSQNNHPNSLGHQVVFIELAKALF